MSLDICGQTIEGDQVCTYPSFMACPIHEKDLEDPGATIDDSTDPRVLLKRAIDHLATGNPNPLHLQRLITSVERLVELQRQLPDREQVNRDGQVLARAAFGMPPVRDQDWEDYMRVLDPDPWPRSPASSSTPRAAASTLSPNATATSSRPARIPGSPTPRMPSDSPSLSPGRAQRWLSASQSSHGASWLRLEPPIRGPLSPHLPPTPRSPYVSPHNKR